MYDIEEHYSRYVELVGGRIISSGRPREVIRDMRQSLGMTQEEMAGLMGLRRETISRIENGVIKPTLGFVEKFCSAVAITKVVRDLRALEDTLILSGKEVSPVTPAMLRLYFDVPMENLTLLFNIGIRGYQKSKAKILKELG
jgi:transcriptional regulator with XRE-family HTH domain